MTRHSAVERQRPASSLIRIVRRVAGASLISLGFGLAVLMIGGPVVGSMWLAHGIGGGIAHAVGGASGLGDAFVWMVSTAAGFFLTALVARGAYQLVRSAVSQSGQMARNTERAARAQRAPAGQLTPRSAAV